MKKSDVMDLTTREPKDHRLFHYTRSLGYLEDMLQNGIWPRYCEEDFEWLFHRRVTLAFPMACFCDIPLDAAITHRGRYGNYAIGFNKSRIGDLDINPVWYVHEESGIAKHLSTSLISNSRFNLSSIENHPLRATLAFLKPTIAFQKDRSVTYTDTVEIFAADEEMEWRHTPAALSNTWLASTRRGFVSETEHALSNAHRLKLSFDQVDCVIVPCSYEAAALGDKFPSLKEKVIAWKS